MNNFKLQPRKDSTPGFSRRASELRSDIRLLPGEILANRTGSLYLPLGAGAGEFHMLLYKEAITGSYPEMKFFSAMGDELPEFQQMLLLYYFATADGTALTEHYVGFADLPGGRIYAQAFQGYSGNEVVKVVGENVAGLRKSCQLDGGQDIGIADAGFRFLLLPRISIQIIYWLGDDEFPSSCNILFDLAATHYLPIDGCAIIGNNLAHRIIKTYQKQIMAGVE